MSLTVIMADDEPQIHSGSWKKSNSNLLLSNKVTKTSADFPLRQEGELREIHQPAMKKSPTTVTKMLRQCAQPTGENINEKTKHFHVSDRHTVPCSVIQCNLIPPTPLKLLEKSSRMSSLACPPFDEGRDSTGESDGEGDDQFIKPAELRTRTCHFQLAKEFLPVKSERRCSAAAKYDVDDNLIKLVALHWNLSLNPNELLGKGSFGTVVAGQYQGKFMQNVK